MLLADKLDKAVLEQLDGVVGLLDDTHRVRVTSVHVADHRHAHHHVVGMDCWLGAVAASDASARVIRHPRWNEIIR